MDFRQFNVTAKKDPYPLPFTKKVLDEMASYEVYSFLGGFFRLSLDYDRPQRLIQDCIHHRLGNIRLGGHAIWARECSTNLSTNGVYNF